jgi:cation diffusion facilitator CzcD-associated flavoprotein CzcO
VRIFGLPMHSWEAEMPESMFLKSEGFASNLSDPDGKLPLRDFCWTNGIDYADLGFPVALKTFVAYGKAFQNAFLPDLKAEHVVELKTRDAGFQLKIADGETLVASRVVVAVGISHFAFIPPEFAGLSSAVLSHSSRCRSVERFRGRTIAVVGAGASAIDVAAALLTVDAKVYVIARSPAIRFGERDKQPRRLWDRLRAPMSGLGQGWRSRFCTDAPLVFHAFPERFRFAIVDRHLGPASAWFMKEHVQGRIEPLLNRRIVQVTEDASGVSLRLSDGTGHEQTLRADHLIAATGYRADVERIPFLSAEIKARVATTGRAPILSRQFESTVPGLYFIGLAAAYSFGPLMRFAFGARFTARRLSAHLTRSLSRRPAPIAPLQRLGAACERDNVFVDAPRLPARPPTASR